MTSKYPHPSKVKSHIQTIQKKRKSKTKKKQNQQIT